MIATIAEKKVQRSLRSCGNHSPKTVIAIVAMKNIPECSTPLFVPGPLGHIFYPVAIELSSCEDRSTFFVAIATIIWKPAFIHIIQPVVVQVCSGNTCIQRGCKHIQL